ncbi:unnamed protein product, partial [marine sediment metagenome]
LNRIIRRVIILICLAVSAVSHADTTDGLAVWWTFSEGENGLQDRTVSAGIDTNNTYLTETGGATVEAGKGVLGPVASKFSAWHGGAGNETEYRNYEGITIWLRYNAAKPGEYGALWRDSGPGGWVCVFVHNANKSKRDVSLILGKENPLGVIAAKAPQLRTTDTLELACTYDNNTGEARIHVGAGSGDSKVYTEKLKPGLLSDMGDETSPTVGNGPRHKNDGDHFRSQIDELRIYNRVLTEDEIKAIEPVADETSKT